MLTYFLTFVPFFFCSLSTRRILLLLAPYCWMSPRWRYVFLFRLLHVFLLPCVIICPISFSPFLYINIYMYASPLIMHSFLFYFAFFRLSPSLSPSITPWLKRFLLPWAHPWRVSSIGPIWWLRPWLLLLLLLHRRFCQDPYPFSRAWTCRGGCPNQEGQ